MASISGHAIRRIILEQSHRAHVGHIGSALSVADIIAALFDRVLRIPHPDHPKRDRFVLSKGHSALAFYAALHLQGRLGQQELETFRADGSPLGTHPEVVLPGVDFATGSLGQGLSMATGAALAIRLQKGTHRVYALMSDAECNEGSVWEAAQFAGHHRLNELTVVVDFNGMQAMGRTCDIMTMENLSERWCAFGWEAIDVDGHDQEAVANALLAPKSQNAKPRVVMARTILGKGVSFMENRLKWHYWPMDDAEFKQAMLDIEPKGVTSA
ncbi:MAG: transketolase [Magnetococcus sp. DMHC-1]|nr:transketolase [Magnetococcales bacterium]